MKTKHFVYQDQGVASTVDGVYCLFPVLDNCYCNQEYNLLS